MGTYTVKLPVSTVISIASAADALRNILGRDDTTTEGVSSIFFGSDPTYGASASAKFGFDTSGIPQDATVVSAVLQFSAARLTGTNIRQAQVILSDGVQSNTFNIPATNAVATYTLDNPTFTRATLESATVEFKGSRSSTFQSAQPLRAKYAELIVTYAYDTEELLLKQNGAWTAASAVYLKQNGVWTIVDPHDAVTPGARYTLVSTQ